MNSVTHTAHDDGPHSARLEELLAKMRRDEARLQQLNQEKILQGSLRGVPSLRKPPRDDASDAADGKSSNEPTSSAAVAAAPNNRSKPFDFVMPGNIVALPELNQETRRFARYRRTVPQPRTNNNTQNASSGYNILCPQSGVPISLPSLPMPQGGAQHDACVNTDFFPPPPPPAAPQQISGQEVKQDDADPKPTDNMPSSPTPSRRPGSQSSDVFTRSQHSSCGSRPSSQRSISRSSSRGGAAPAGGGPATSRRIEKLERLLLEERQGRLDVLQKMQQLTAFVLKSTAPLSRIVPKPPMPR